MTPDQTYQSLRDRTKGLTHPTLCCVGVVTADRLFPVFARFARSTSIPTGRNILDRLWMRLAGPIDLESLQNDYEDLEYLPEANEEKDEYIKESMACEATGLLLSATELILGKGFDEVCFNIVSGPLAYANELHSLLKRIGLGDIDVELAESAFQSSVLDYLQDIEQPTSENVDWLRQETLNGVKFYTDIAEKYGRAKGW